MSAVNPVSTESKSAKKRKAKGDNATSGSGANTPAVDAVAPELPAPTNGVEAAVNDSAVVKDLTRNIRNIHKKLAASTKADAVITENPNVSLDDLVAAKKLNADQKAQILKKPALQAQLAQLEEQLTAFRGFARDMEERAAKELAAVQETHDAEISALKAKAAQEAEDAKSKAIEDSLRMVTHFLHTAASKRQSEEADTDEGRAFEGALLLVYQGNDTSLSTLKNLIYGTNDKVPDVNGDPLDFTFAQVKQSATIPLNESVDTTIADVAETQPEDGAASASASASAPAIQTDVTVANAALTELADTTAAVQTDSDPGVSNETKPVAEQASTAGDAANAVANWDPQASMVTDTSVGQEDWVQVPRDPTETDTGLANTPAAVHGTSNWAEEVGAATAEGKATPENDGFEQVRRERGRGRGGRGGRGDFRGRGRGGRGDGYRGGRGVPIRGGRGGQRGDKN